MSCGIAVPVGETCPVCQQSHGTPKRSTGTALVLIGLIGIVAFGVFMYYRHHSPYYDGYTYTDWR